MDSQVTKHLTVMQLSDFNLGIVLVNVIAVKIRGNKLNVLDHDSIIH